MIKAVLFDLDGTLLPLDQDKFVEYYFKTLAARLASHGYDPKRLVASILKGTEAMLRNTGERSNEEVFWERFSEIYGKDARSDEPLFNAYYDEDFDKVKAICGYDERAAEILRELHSKGVRTVLATNPVFPRIATEKRMAWAGLSPLDFELFTTYENIGYAKPNPDYYREILRRIGLSAEECVMVGNDVDDDMVAQELGIKVFLLTDNLVNRQGKNIEVFARGGFAELKDFLQKLCS